MRFKGLLVALMISVSFFALGCGGGGDSGSGTVVTGAKVSGSAAVPVAAVDSWAASIRAAFDYTKLTVKAYGEKGTVLAQGTVNTDGTFSLTVTPDNNVTIVITSAKGLDLRYNIGALSGDKGSIVVDATSTAQLMVAEYGLSTSGSAFTTVLNAIITALSTAPTGTTSLYDLVKTAQGSTLSTYKDSQDKVTAVFTALETALKAKNITDTMANFSQSFTTSNSALKATVSYENFKSVTSDRFTRYTIDTYTFNITSITFIDATTAQVSGNASVSVTTIATGGKVSAKVDNQTVTLRVENGKWVVYSDFPYLKDQLGF